jgi:hypothetical protein
MKEDSISRDHKTSICIERPSAEPAWNHPGLPAPSVHARQHKLGPPAERELNHELAKMPAEERQGSFCILQPAKAICLGARVQGYEAGKVR